ncbi:hypothetical protein [Terasakiella pusilla]|uniref:hypothetical protein n=1 Tax=Terasakiella pusilla TaxID=64973 RepID=UPI003AA8619E
MIFEHDFGGYNFPLPVDFSDAILKKPDFSKCTFNASYFRRAETAYPHAPDERYAGGFLMSAVFVGTIFDGSVDFWLEDVGDLGFYFSKIVISEKCPEFYFDLKSRENDNEKIRSIVVFNELSLLDTRFYFSISGVNTKVKFKMMDSEFFQGNSYVSAQVSSLDFNFLDNKFNKSRFLLEGLNCLEGASCINFSRNNFNESELNIKNIKILGNIKFYDEKLEKTPVIISEIEVCAYYLSICSFLDCFYLIQHSLFKKIFCIHGVVISSAEEDLRINFRFNSNTILGELCEFSNCTLKVPVSLSGSRFEGAMKFTGTEFNSIPDLRLTKLGSHFSFDGIKFDSLTSYDSEIETSKYKEQSDKYRRLKELAIISKDHDRELEFFASEMRAKRFCEVQKYKKVLNFFYDKLSDYGRSVGKPVIGLNYIFERNYWIFFSGVHEPNSYYWGEIESKCEIICG